MARFAHRDPAILVASCLASFMFTMDVAMVNIAIPSISRSLQLTPTGEQWFVSGYALAFSALPLIAGRLADLFGHRRTFLSGLTLFTFSAAACAAASDVLTIEVARAVQGVGGAVLASTTLSLLTSRFTEPRERSTVLGIWGAVVAIGATSGVLLGGVLTSQLGWRALFVTTATVGAVTLLVTIAGGSVPDKRVPGPRHGMASGVLAAAGLALVVWALVGVTRHGWASPHTLSALAGGVATIAVFFVVDARSSFPLLPAALLRNRHLSAANAVTALVGSNLYFLYLAVSLYLQRVDHDGPLRAGVLSLPAALSVGLAALLSPLVLRRVGPRVQLVAAMAINAAGFWWLSSLGVGGGYWTRVGFPLVVIGLGFGLSFLPATLFATTGVPGELTGVAAGLVGTSRYVGRSVGLAALTSLATSGLPGPQTRSSLAAGDTRAFVICGVVAAVGMVIAIVFLRSVPGPLGERP